MDNLEEIDTFLVTYNFPRMFQEKTISVDQLLPTKIDSVLKNLPRNENPSTGCLTGKFYHIFEEELRPVLLKLFQKIQEGMPQAHFMRPALP